LLDGEDLDCVFEAIAVVKRRRITSSGSPDDLWIRAAETRVACLVSRRRGRLMRTQYLQVRMASLQSRQTSDAELARCGQVFEEMLPVR
jgi:hypothetical protein